MFIPDNTNIMSTMLRPYNVYIICHAWCKFAVYIFHYDKYVEFLLSIYAMVYLLINNGLKCYCYLRL